MGSDKPDVPPSAALGYDAGVLALTAFKATFGLIIVFGVVFPVLVQGIIAVIAAAVAGERRRNQAYEAEHGGHWRH